jgi:alkylated DNA repair protein (DNA oxidative demethylase)
MGTYGNLIVDGMRLFPGHLDRPAQEAMLAAIRAVIGAAPLYTPRMPKSGKPMSVRMTNCGVLGWVTDERGYRYQPTHPETGRVWPPIPELLLDLWRNLSGYPYLPEACLINVYGGNARMGLHQDRDEQNFAAPVHAPKRSDPVVSPRFGRCGRARRRRAPRLPRRRQDHARHLHPHCGRRQDQSHIAAGDRPGSVIDDGPFSMIREPEPLERPG